MTAALASLRDSAPRTMAEALDSDDPYEALMSLSVASKKRATKLSEELTTQLADFVLEIPDIVIKAAKESESMENPVSDAMACADSILNSLTKIASGGSQASLEIRKLEQEKADLEQHSRDVETALWLRTSCDKASSAIPSRQYDVAAGAIQQFTQLKAWNRISGRARAYAGEYTIQQLEQHHVTLKKLLLEQYEVAVQQSDLQRLGQMTPLLPKVQLEQEAVSLYLKYLQAITAQEFTKAIQTAPVPKGASAAPPFALMARVYNAAVTVLRHHLPLISHCLHRAKGDAAVAQLVHVQVEQHVLPLFQKYIETRELPLVSQSAQRISGVLEDKYSGRGLDYDGEDEDDCGFASEVGTLADVDAAMEEAALCLQHAESYTRFMNHSVQEINKARALRFHQEQEEKRVERERQEWATGMSTTSSSRSAEDYSERAEYEPLEILPARTQLQEVVWEVGGYYSGIERCLLLASMQRAFTAPETDPRYCSPLGFKGQSSHIASRALQTSMVETCLYTARRSTQRAFATGHTGTASAVANFAADALSGVLMTVMSQRVEEIGVHRLKPGEGLLVGGAGLFFQNIRHGGAQAQQAHHPTPKQKLEEETKRRETQMEMAKTCAYFNDLEIAMHHTKQLETLLADAIIGGFPPNTHETDQLLMCVKSLSTVSEGFQLAANTAIESLVTVLKPRLRNIVGEVAGAEGSANFMGVGGKSGDRVLVKMNYDLDDESYQMMQLSEGYMGRMCTLLDELILPLQPYFAPRLWDNLMLGVLGATCKRLEQSIRKCPFTALGAICLDSDMRDLLGYAKERLDSPELKSNVALYRACVPLARLMQISRLVNVDDLDDVIDLITSSKRKGGWDLKLDESKAFLCLRKEFSAEKVNELLHDD
ncbi:Golgi complex subunit 4 [Seminavis robusta]|uniref:Conserved oligomeric Golgi complex subunit 4 n=1 Tax=Seminavis robusta TaxID=568900 RepID=A0A9N8DAP3_9STRA|nr:Golgi complex subunit 4 [Seminavis robusta]|eukprot:Sro17_g012600.1 Golgi complex subunit 4 (883) ;mRNA; f:159713-162450